jgi:hypothetical protein
LIDLGLRFNQRSVTSKRTGQAKLEAAEKKKAKVEKNKKIPFEQHFLEVNEVRGVPRRRIISGLKWEWRHCEGLFVQLVHSPNLGLITQFDYLLPSERAFLAVPNVTKLNIGTYPILVTDAVAAIQNPDVARKDLQKLLKSMKGVFWCCGFDSFLVAQC